MKENRYELNKQLAQMLKGGVIMDVTTPEQAKIAEYFEGLDRLITLHQRESTYFTGGFYAEQHK